MSLEEENGQNEQPNSEELKKLLRLKRDELRNKCTALNILFDMKDKKKGISCFNSRKEKEEHSGRRYKQKKEINFSAN